MDNVSIYNLVATNKPTEQHESGMWGSLAVNARIGPIKAERRYCEGIVWSLPC